MSLLKKASSFCQKTIIPLVEKGISFFRAVMVRVAGLFSPFVRLVRKLYFRFLKDKVSRVLEFIDRIQTKYLKKGQLKNYVLVRYIVKELLLYFVVAFLFFFMIFFLQSNSSSCRADS